MSIERGSHEEKVEKVDKEAFSYKVGILFRWLIAFFVLGIFDSAETAASLISIYALFYVLDSISKPYVNSFTIDLNPKTSNTIFEKKSFFSKLDLFTNNMCTRYKMKKNYLLFSLISTVILYAFFLFPVTVILLLIFTAIAVYNDSITITYKEKI